MCYMVAAITIMLRIMDGVRKWERKKCLASCLLTLSLSFKLIVSSKMAPLWHDAYSKPTKQKVLHVHRETCMEYDFDKACCPELQLNWIIIGFLMMRCLFPVIKSEFDIHFKLSKIIYCANNCCHWQCFIISAVISSGFIFLQGLLIIYQHYIIIPIILALQS